MKIDDDSQLTLFAAATASRTSRSGIKRSYWTEDLLLRDPNLRIDVGEDGGR